MLSNQLSAILENIQLSQEKIKKEQLQKELEMAKEIQNALLPHSFPTVKNCLLTAINLSCLEVSGDYYDIWTLPDGRLASAIGDVSGKGAPAALLMSSVQSALRSLFIYRSNLSEILYQLNNLIYQNTKGKRFITFFCSIYNAETKELSYINAGHNYPYLLKNNGEVYTLEEGGLILGVIPNTRFHTGKIELEAGDFIFFYTDGITEAFNDNEEEYGEERLLKFLLKNKNLSPTQIKTLLIEDIQNFTKLHPQSDDMTFVILKIVQ